MAFYTTVKRSISVVTLLLLVACSSTKGKDDQPAELVKFDAEVTIKRIWSSGVGGVFNEYMAGPRPVVHNGVVYAATGNGKVVAVNADTGKRLWKAKLNKGLSGGVGIGGSQVYVGNIDGQLFALNMADGIQQWQAQLSSEVLSSAAGNDDAVAVQTNDGKLYMLDADTGEELWKHTTESPPLTNNGTSSPLLAKDMVLAASADGKVVSLSAMNGSMRWEQRISAPRGHTELDKLRDIDGELVLDGEVLYVTSYQGAAMALSRSNGGVLWEQKSSSIHGPAVTDSRVFLVEDHDYVRALRSSGGQQLWESDQLKLRKLTAPVAIGDYMAVADISGYLHILDATDGHIVGRKKVDGSGVRVPMATDGKTLYVQDHDGTLSAYRLTAKNK